MPKMTGGEAIVQSLIAHGVDTLFGLPGVQNDYLYNALYDARDQIRVIHPRHEQGAGYMALGYALSTGNVGVCSVVPGPGFLNASAALATAYSINARMLYLVGQIPSYHIGRAYGYLHEIPDQLGMLRTLTKWADRIDSPAQAPERVGEAFYQLLSGRPRPVGLECAPDVLSRQTEVDITPPAREIRHPPVDADAVAAAAEHLAAARNPLIFVGSGAIEAANAVRHLAELLQAPVVSTRSGHGILSSDHPLSLRPPEAHVLWRDADVVLSIGSRMHRPLLHWGVDDDLTLIQIDIDPAEIGRMARPTLGITARAEDVVPALVATLSQAKIERPARAEELAALREEIAGQIAHIEPQLSFLRAIRAALPRDGFLVDDFTQVGYVSRYVTPVHAPRTFISPDYQGTLGWSFAVALGVKVANPDKPVLAVVGDGGFMFNVQEVATAVQHGIATVTVIFNDGAYGNVKRMQKENYDGRVIATDLQNPDFLKLAESFGAQGLRVHEPDELEDAIRAGFAKTDGPTLIEVPVGEMPAPWRSVMLGRARPKR